MVAKAPTLNMVRRLRLGQIFCQAGHRAECGPLVSII